MRLWEENRTLISFIGGFLFIYLLFYVFFFSGNYSAGETFKEKLESEKKQELLDYFGKGARLDFLKKEYAESSKTLDLRYKKIEEMISRPFPKDIIPDAYRSRMQFYVRKVYPEIKGGVLQKISGRKISMAEGVENLGIDLSEEYGDETPEMSLGFLERIYAVRDLIEIIIPISEDKDGLTLISSIDSIESSAAELSGPDANFIKEIPVEMVLTASMEGLTLLLYELSQADKFNTVRELEIISEPKDRTAREILLSRRRKNDGSIIRTLRSEHYYTFRLVVARVMLSEPGKAVVRKSSGDGAPKPIPH